MLNLNLTLSVIVTTVDETELNFIHESATLYTAMAGKDTKEYNNSVGNTINYFQVTPEIENRFTGQKVIWAAISHCQSYDRITL